MFTLGFDTDRHTGGRAVDFVAAGTGMVLVALQIAYLPTIYSAYNRRETLVTLLESRAGAPAWGPELLIRHQLVGLIDNLPNLFADWEVWAADVAESHTSYPLAPLFPVPPPSQLLGGEHHRDHGRGRAHDGARSGRLTQRSQDVRPHGVHLPAGHRPGHRISYDPDPSPDSDIQLPRSEFDAAVARLEEIGYPITRSLDEAWAHFKGWRINYESTGYALAQLVDAPPARWTGPRRLFHGESLEPARPVDRQPHGAPPGVFARRRGTELPIGGPAWTERNGPGSRRHGDAGENPEPVGPGPAE